MDKISTETRSAHEHYSIKLILQSELSNLIGDLDVDPLYVSYLIDERVEVKDDQFFISEGINFKPILKQLISSDLDMDKMDYLQRDSYFCGVDFGYCDHEWILQNLKIHVQEGKAFLAIDQKAIHSVESFLLGRRHISLTVYFHNQMVIMDEMLSRYFKSSNCSFRIPKDWQDYLHCTDGSLFEHLKKDSQVNEWARRIVEHKPYEKIFERWYPLLNPDKSLKHLEKIKNYLHQVGIDFIHTNSLKHMKRLYYLSDGESPDPVYIMSESPNPLHTLRERMKVFYQLNQIQLIDRIYVSPEQVNPVKENPLFQ